MRHCSTAQITGSAPMHVPAVHRSLRVQALPSSQVVPFAAGGLLHRPVAGLQAPAAWHWSLAVQVTELLPTQAPAWQESDWVQALPSLQAEPSAAGGLLHRPVAGLQTPAA
jgi:hypothetical protein